ncbi:MAG: hypothetical protein LC808_29415 [Actinobacteria bacterium]|nr:hypothetical protein [Actinomycetota bacterium]
MALIRELQEERDAEVDGFPAAIERLQALAARIDASNPFYRYVGAEADSPIELKFNLVIGVNEEDVLASFRDAIYWGGEVELPARNVRDVVVDAPHGLGVSLKTAQIRISPESQEQIDLRLRLIVRSPAGHQLSALPARLVSRTRGQGGLTLLGRDLTGIVNTRVRLDYQLRKVELNITYNEPQDILPGALLPIVRFMQHATAPNTLSFGVGDTPPSAPAQLSHLNLDPPTYLAFVEGLTRVQDAAGEAFPVPPQWTRTDELEIRRAVRLLNGERVQLAHGVIHFVQDSAAMLDAAGDSLHSLGLDMREPYTFNVCGHEIDLGPYTAYVQQGRFSLDPLPGQPETDFRIAFTPEPGCGIEVALGSLSHDPGLPPALPA